MTTKTFTITAVDMESDSMLVLQISGTMTGALALQLRVNGQSGSFYNDAGRYIKGGAETLIQNSSQAQSELIASGNGGTNADFNGQVRLYFTLSSTADRLHIHSDFTGSGTEHHTVMGNTFQTAITSITSITIMVSTSSIKANHRMTLYKVSRT